MLRHGKDTQASLDGNDISPWTTQSEITEAADSHDVTAYGDQEHQYRGGLKDGTVTLEGNYFSGATGPSAVITPLIGTNVTFIRQPEGVGTALPQDSVPVLVVNYVETAPVADMITWSAELQISGAVDRTPQA